MNCPECEATLSVPADAQEGELVSCPDCGSDYVVTSGGQGMGLKKAEKVGEDWGE